MNRARPINIVLHAMLAACWLLLASLAASAQNNPRDPNGALARLTGKTRAARAGQPHIFRGNMDRIPSELTKRRWDPNHPLFKGRTRVPGDGPVTRQTILITKRNPAQQFSQDPAPAQDQHPFWTLDEKYIYFDSNRNSDTDPTPRPDQRFNIFRAFADGSGVTQITTGSDNKIEPAVSTDGTRLAYVAGGTVTTPGQPNPATSGFNLFVLNFANNEVRGLTQINPSNFAFSDVRHPTWSPGGNLIAFAGQLGVGQLYDIFIVNTDTGVITRLTTGNSNEYAPAWSPDGNVIAFTSNATGFSTGAGPVTPTGIASNDDIFIISPNTFRPNWKKITGASFNGTASTNKNPAWSTLRPDPLQIVPGETDPNNVFTARQMLAFASNRADTNRDGTPNAVVGTFDIYFMQASVRPDPAIPGSFTVTTPESPGNPPLKLQTSTPDTAIDQTEVTAAFDPNFTSNEDYPAWPQYISSYRIAFQSDRATAIGTNLNIWASTIFDINAPTLLKFDIPNNEIIRVSRDATPNVPQREFSAGDLIRFRARFVDYETGIESAYIQIKNPNSQPQGFDRQEHKVYFVGPGALDDTTSVINAPYEWDAQAINPNFDLPTWRQPGFPGAHAQFGSIPSEWPGWNLYVPGIDDELAFSGGVNLPDPDFWLQLYDDGAFDDPDPALRGNEPSGEKRGDGIYSRSWRTPASLPSDWIVDVIVRDRAVNPFDPNITTNWKIYDNIWGFTTQPFQSRGQILYIGDYDCGQKFFITHFGAGTQFQGQSFTAWPTESWMTEMDPALLPTAYVQATTLGNLINVLMPLGQNSYSDGLTNDGTNFPVTGRYDIWRIICRGPVPDSVLNQYGARIEVQPPDILDQNNPGPRQQVVAERYVIWHAPYTGDLFTSNGTLVDTNVQNQLRGFVQRGGRLFVNGQDVAWGLSLGGGAPNAFLNQVLRVTYIQDFPNPDPATFNQINLLNTQGSHPIVTQTWYNGGFHAYPNTIPYDPPALGPIYLGSVTGTTRAWMCPNQDTFDVVDFSGVPAGDEFVPPGGALPKTAGIDGRYASQTAEPNEAIMWMVDNATTRGKIAFSPFGWEGINPEFYSAGTGLIALKNRKVEMMHNLGDYMRTGRIIGFVRNINGATALNQVFIRAVNLQTGATAATALSQSDGSYVLNGLEADGLYIIDAFRAGFLTLHLQANLFHGGYQSRVDVFLTPAQPGTISGRVTLLSNNQPIAGAVVVATDPITGDQFTGTSLTDGTYTIKNVPVINDPTNPNNPAGYIVRITNLAELGYDSSQPPSYGGGEPGAQPAVQVAPSQDVTGIDFALKPIPGSISGRVTRGDTNAPIEGATVTATSGMLQVQANTAADGTYSITGLEPGTYGLVATAVGFGASASISATVTSNQNTPDINFQLLPIPPGSISGLVRTSNDQAVSGATITLTDLAGNPVRDGNGNPITATTGAEQTVAGYRFNFKIDNVPAGGQVQVRARKDGFQPDPTPPFTVTVPSQDEAKNVILTLNPEFTFTRNLSLVSAPYEYTKPVTQLFNIPAGDVTSGAFVFVTWDGTKYISTPTPPADTFHLGRGYFMEATNPNTVLALTERGTPANETRDFEIPLQAGWNLIGTPFKFPINFLGLKIREANGTIQDVTAAQGGNNPALGGALWTFENGGYLVAYTLDPWRGYWIRAFRAVTLLVSPAARQDRSVHTRDANLMLLSGNAKGEGWKLDLFARTTEATSAPGLLGVTRAASDGYDRFKLESPPAVGEKNVTLTFDHTDWGDKSGKYNMDVRSSATASQTWEFTVTSNVPNAPVTLVWPNVATVPGKQNLILTDLDSKVTVNLRSRGNYVIPATNGPMTRRFRLQASRATRQKLALVDVAAVMNGGGPGRAATSVGISYKITADASVQVNILKGGRRIRTVDPGRHRAAGSSESVTWDLKTDTGIAVPADQYTVEVKATDENGQTVRRITPLLISR